MSGHSEVASRLDVAQFTVIVIVIVIVIEDK